VLLLQERFFRGWASDFCTTDLPDIFGQKSVKASSKMDKTSRNSSFLARKLTQNVYKIATSLARKGFYLQVEEICKNLTDTLFGGALVERTNQPITPTK
jgi:hypothetical protein